MERVGADVNSVGLTVNGIRKVSFLIARQLAKRKANYRAQWRVCRTQNPSGLLIVLRLDETNQAIEDYLLLPAKRRTKLDLSFRKCRWPDTARFAPRTWASLYARSKFD